MKCISILISKGIENQITEFVQARKSGLLADTLGPRGILLPNLRM